MNWSKIQIWSCRKCCFTIPLSFYYCWNWPPWPFFWIPSLDAMLIFVPNGTRHHWHYSDPNTVQRVGNLSRSMASRILNYAKTALLLLGPSVGNPHEQFGRPQPPSVTHRAITAHFPFAPFSIEAKFKYSIS